MNTFYNFCIYYIYKNLKILRICKYIDSLDNISYIHFGILKNDMSTRYEHGIFYYLKADQTNRQTKLTTTLCNFIIG